MTAGSTGGAAVRGKRVLVTGGAGFIGSHLVDALVDAGAEVRVLDDFSTGRRSNLERSAGAVALLEGDLRRREDCREACAGVEIVFHQAALGSVPRSMDDPATTFEINVQGTVNLLAAAREAEVGRVVYASSSSVYGDSPENPRRESREGRALSPYAESKQVVERSARLFHRTFGLRSLGLRYFNVYGPRQDPSGPYAAVVPAFFHRLLEGRPVEIHGDGLQTRDFTFVGDAVGANLLAAAAPDELCSGRAFNVGGGRATSVLDLAARIATCLGLELAARHGPPRAGDVAHSAADLTAAAEALGFRPATGLDDGLASCRDHYRAAAAAARGVTSGDAT